MDLQKIFDKFPKSEDYLIEILLEIQDQNEQHYLRKEDLQAVAKHLGVTEAKVTSVVSFYTLFNLEPKGKFIIQVCKDVPCYVTDNFNLLETLKELLKIDLGETTKDGLFSLETTSCLGCCDQSPVMRINHDIYASLTKESTKKLIDQLRGQK